MKKLVLCIGLMLALAALVSPILGQTNIQTQKLDSVEPIDSVAILKAEIKELKRVHFRTFDFLEWADSNNLIDFSYILVNKGHIKKANQNNIAVVTRNKAEFQFPLINENVIDSTFDGKSVKKIYMANFKLHGLGDYGIIVPLRSDSAFMYEYRLGEHTLHIPCIKMGSKKHVFYSFAGEMVSVGMKRFYRVPVTVISTGPDQQEVRAQRFAYLHTGVSKYLRLYIIELSIDSKS